MIHHSYMIEDNQISKRQLGRLESLYSIGNGNIGFRGYHIDQKLVHQPSLFMNGFYELAPIVYGEDAYGYARWNQTMIPLPDIRTIKVRVNGEDIHLCLEQVTQYSRRLDFFTGIFSYSFEVSLQNDIEITLSVETLVSMVHKECGGAQIVIEANKEVEIEITQSIEYPENEKEVSDDPRKQTAQIKKLEGSHFTFHKEMGVIEGMSGTFKTHLSNLSVHLMSQNFYSSKPSISKSSYNELQYPQITYTFTGDQLTFSTLFYYGSTKKKDSVIEKKEIELKREFLKEYSFSQLVEEQKAHFTTFWSTHDIVVSGNDEIQRALRLNIFQLHQSTGTDGKTSLSAKGLTGSGYEGHYF